MDYNYLTDSSKKEDSGNIKINIRDIIDKYVVHWKWFAITIVTSIIVMYFQLNFTHPQYQAISAIQINSDKGGSNSNLSIFQDLGIASNTKDKVDDEIEILKSKSLINEVVKSLNLNISFFTDKNYMSKFLDDNLLFNTEFYEKERYLDPPLKINFFISDSALYHTKADFIINVKSDTEYVFRDLKNSIERNHAFGEKITTSFGGIIITPNTDLKQEKLIGEKIYVNIQSIEDLVNAYVKTVIIEPKGEFSNIVTLKNSEGVKEKAEDFLNELVKKYNDRAIRIKEEITKSTSDFVNERLEILSNELSLVDLTAESIKTRFRMSDEGSDTGIKMQSGQVVENQIVQANTELEKINYIKDFVATKDDTELIPVNIGVADNNISTTMQQYNQLLMQKKRLLENSTEKNPIVVNINEQLKDLRNNIDQGLNNVASSQRISLDALNKQGARINSRLYSVPKQERQYRDVQRQQQIKETLYLYLLQKREETAITLGVEDPNAKILDKAESLPNRISPKKGINYGLAGIIGLLIPICFIYVYDLLDSKIHTKQEVEKALNVPIIGDIPKLDTKDRYLIKKEDYSSIAEAFRILRTNLSFIIPNTGSKKAKVIFITSTIAHEGKSLVSSNLASVLTHAGKRTLILGMDIRAPKIKSYLGVRGKKGVTNFIVNNDISVEDIILKAPNSEILDIISSGDIAPNPAELLMSPRVTELFEYAKDNYEYVIVDTAAYSMVTDTLLISHFADAFIYVIRANFLDKRALSYIDTIYKEKKLPNMCLLINGIDFKKSYGYGYGYGYGNKFEKSRSSWYKFGKV